MDKEKRLCPFRKVCETVTKPGMMKQYADKYSTCLGDRCMAYDGGECLKLKAAKNIAENLKETALLWIPDIGRLKCPRCRESFDESSAYCPNCGQRLEERA